MNKFHKSTFASFLIGAAMSLSSVASADILVADVGTSNVIQGDFQTGASNAVLLNNNNSRRVGTGGTAGNQRVNVPVLGFTLPTLPAGQTISQVSLSVTIDSPATNGTPFFDAVVSLMGTVDQGSISTADYTTDINSLGAGNVLWGTFGVGDVVALENVTISLTSGAAFDQFAALYDGAGNPSQAEVFFRFSPSAFIDTTDSANANLRFNFEADGTNFPVFRSLEITTVPEPSTVVALLGLVALGFAFLRRRR